MSRAPVGHPPRIDAATYISFVLDKEEEEEEENTRMRMDAPRPVDASVPRTSEDIVKEARSRGVDGAMMLAASVQRWLFVKEGDPDFWSKLGSAPEFGARIWTLLDTGVRNVGYYRGNYEAWLRRKGYNITLTGRDRDVHTTMARS